MQPTISTPKYDLYLADCLDVMREMEAGSVDAILTDIPYGTTQCSWDEIIPFAPMWEGVKRVLNPHGVFVTTSSQPFTSKLVMSNLEWFKFEWIWNKILGTGHLNCSKLPLKSHENILVFSSATNGNYTYNPIMKRRGKLRHKGGTGGGGNGKEVYGKYGDRHSYNNEYYPVSIIEVSNGDRTREEVGNHPTQKPEALYSYLVETYTRIGDTVLDICAGSGTTGVACMQLGRRFIGIEIEEKYFEIAAKRIERAAMQDPLFTL